MDTVTRWLAPAVMATGLGLATLVPLPARAESGDDLVRVLVDVADVVLRGGTPYYRYGDYGYDDRLIVSRDRYGRPLYYRQVPRGYQYDHRYDHRYTSRQRQVTCNSHGRCKVTYYDPRYDRHRYRYDRRYDDRYYGYYDDRRWRDDD
ncbi:hypothetical protein ACFQZQ_06370 [Lysobacter koreensis]|uniref:Uncharacterized protein n=1 Tax=Lysobacter koreensis TaxID=266122 RepID=A0ABW2YKS4_9GAMM